MNDDRPLWVKELGKDPEPVKNPVEVAEEFWNDDIYSFFPENRRLAWRLMLVVIISCAVIGAWIGILFMKITTPYVPDRKCQSLSTEVINGEAHIYEICYTSLK